MVVVNDRLVHLSILRFEISLVHCLPFYLFFFLSLIYLEGKQVSKTNVEKIQQSVK